MIDIETLSTTTRAIVPEIGAVLFDEDIIYGAKSWFVDVQAQRHLGRISDEGTMAWWNRQPEGALDRILHPVGPVFQPVDALNDLTEFISKCDYLWANGAAFDFGILSDLFFTVIPGQCPLDKRVRDLRTLSHIVNKLGRTVKRIQPVQPHHALDDALAQTQWVQALLKELA